MYHLLGALVILFGLRAESRPRVMLSPSGVVPVCPESRISFRCSTNLTFLEWIVTVPQSGRLNSKSEIVTAETLLDLDLDIGGHVFHINRNSAYNSYPLESVLTIANATTTLMATKINCTERSFNERSSSIAIIDIINTHPDPPDVGVPRALEFRREGIIVLIDWNPSQYNDINIVYDVEGIPQVTIVFTNSSSTKLQVSYNTQYSVRITATLCGHSNASTTVALKFIKCIHPHNLPMIDESVRAFLDTDPPVMETNATFSCLPGYVFRGPYMSTCMENGKWEPDPRKAECLVDCNPPSLPSNGIIYPYTSTIEGAVVNFVCQKSALDLEENVSMAVCNEHGNWDPDPAEFCTRLSASGTNQETLIASVAVVSSIAAVIVTLLLCIIGFYRGCNRQKRHKVKKRKKPRPRKPTPPPKELYYNLRPSLKQDSGMELSEGMQPTRPIAMYDDVILPSEQDLKEQNIPKPKVMYDEVLPPSEQDQVDLKKNTAYRPADMK